MLLRRFLHSSGRSRWRGDRGTTLAELMVAVSLSAVIASMVVSVSLANRNIYQKDLSRTKVNEDLRSALNIIGSEIRQAGERFPASFPAILITNGASTNPDELTLRRNLLSQVIVGCDTRTATTSYSTANLSKTAATTAACTAPNQANNYTAWYNYANPLGTQQSIYIFNQTTRNGEFLKLLATVGGTSAGVQYIAFTPKTFAYAYTAEYTSIYMINQWKVQLVNGVLQIIVNEDTTNPQNVIDGVTAFQVEAVMQDGTTKTSLANTDNWTLVQAIRLTITGTENMPGRKTTVRTVVGEYFPRNILSN